MGESTKHDDVTAFWAGRARGVDPQPQVDAADDDGRAVTSPSSSWNHQLCTTCGHSFRRGDEVRIIRDPEYRVVHSAPALRCDPDVEPDGEPAEPSQEFAAGLLRTWPVAEHVPVTQLKTDDWRVARPGLSRPPTCLYCAHTFRPGEHVVVCPCGPGASRCGAAVHRDPAAGLSCWEAWRPDSALKICPVTLERVSDGRA